jgi:drug/metabolite transporter (DMT)-like permease
MNPVVIALIAPFLWALVNHADKYLLSKYLKTEGIGALILFSSLFAIIVIPIIGFIEPNALHIPINGALVMMSAGFLYGIAILFYLKALNEDEASIVVPFFQLIPIFAYIFGLIFLKEVLNLNQIAGGLIMIAGAFILSVDEAEGGFKLKNKLLFFVLACIIPYGLMEVLFKYVAIDVGYWEATFWHYVGYLIFGLLLYFFNKIYREEFWVLVKDNSAPIMGLNFGSETLTLVGDRVIAFATLLAPVALIQLVNVFQPIFVLIIGVLLTLFLPHIAEENISRRHLFQKIAAIVIICIGSALSYF